MKPKNLLWHVLMMAVIAVIATQVQGQSSDALLYKLVEKGILTTKEADELRQEAARNPPKIRPINAPWPEWVTGFKFSGDFRGRIDRFASDNPTSTSRTRYRYRLRLGAAVALKDDFEIGLRLASADPASGPGGT